MNGNTATDLSGIAGNEEDSTGEAGVTDEEARCSSGCLDNQILSTNAYPRATTLIAANAIDMARHRGLNRVVTACPASLRVAPGD
jgi:hypothetical protein